MKIHIITVGEPKLAYARAGWQEYFGRLRHYHSLRVTHVNLNDQTMEGLAHRELPMFSVQYHPEAAPGPHDAAPLFDRYLGMVRAAR